MTELNILYGNENNEINRDDRMSQKDDKNDTMNMYSVNDENKLSSSKVLHNMASSQQIQQPIQQLPEQHIQQPSYPMQKQMNQQYRKNNMNNYSFWDRMNMKKEEVIKLAIFSLVIVFAIALDRIGTHYISKYITENVLTEIQEFLLRLSYPIVIFLLLWITKSL